MPVNNRWSDPNQTNLGLVELFIRLITLPEETGQLSVKPAINKLQWIAQTKSGKLIIIHEIDFKDADSAKSYYSQCQIAFVR